MSSSAPKTRTCPLGHVCDVCMWQVTVTKQHRTTGEIEQFEDCAVPQLIPLLTNLHQETDRVSDAVNGFRNEMVHGNNQFLSMLAHGGEDK